MASVRFEQVEKAYGDVRIIKGVDLDIVDGEFLVLVGPSGCGKSTMLRCVAGLEEVTGGKLHIGDRVVNDVAPRDRGVAMVFQSYALYPHMTVRDNMAFGLKIRKAPQAEIDARIADAARLLDIEQYLDRLPKQLSGGQRQRVAIGRAIVRQPDVFLFDEPLSNLDAALRTQMRVELKKLHRDLGTTMIYVTHDQVEAMTLANRIAILRDGLLQQVGSPAEVFEHPANRFVASFIGSPSTNFLAVRGEGTRLVGNGFEFELGRATDRITEIGIRPQHLDLVSDSPLQLTGRVEVIEPMGWEAYLHMTVGGSPVIAHVRADEIRTTKPGDELTFGVEPGRLHLFDSAGEVVR